MTTTTPADAPITDAQPDVTEDQRPHVTIKLPSLRRRKGVKATAHIGSSGDVTMIRLRDKFTAWISRKSTAFRGWLSRRSTFTKFFVFFTAIGVTSFLCFFASYLFAYGVVVPALAWAGNTAFGWQVVTVAGNLTGFGTFLYGTAEFVGVIGGIAAFISMLGPIDRFFGIELY